MSQWGRARHRLLPATVTPTAARPAAGAPGGELPVEPGPHVACGYQIVLPGDRVVHESGLTLHGPAGEGSLPPDLVAAMEALLRHAQDRVQAQEGIPPA